MFVARPIVLSCERAPRHGLFTVFVSFVLWDGVSPVTGKVASPLLGETATCTYMWNWRIVSVCSLCLSVQIEN